MATKFPGEPATLDNGNLSVEPALPLEKKKRIPKVAVYVAGSAFALSLGLTIMIIPFVRQAARANAAAIAAAESRAAQRASSGIAPIPHPPAPSLPGVAGAAPGALGLQGGIPAAGVNRPSYSHASMAAENPVDLAEMERIEQAEAATASSRSGSGSPSLSHPLPLHAAFRPNPSPPPSHPTPPPAGTDLDTDIPSSTPSLPAYTHATLAAEEPLSPGEIEAFERLERLESASNLAELSAGTPSTPTSLPGTARLDDHEHAHGHDAHSRGDVPSRQPPPPHAASALAPQAGEGAEPLADEVARLIAEDQGKSQDEMDEELEGDAAGRQLGAMTAAKAFGVATVLVWGVAGLGLWGVAKAVGAEDMDDLSVKMREQLAVAMPGLTSSVNKPGRSVDGFDGEAIDEWVAKLEREDELAEQAELAAERAAEAAKTPS